MPLSRGGMSMPRSQRPIKWSRPRCDSTESRPFRWRRAVRLRITTPHRAI
jgi:hypothetical protein